MFHGRTLGCQKIVTEGGTEGWRSRVSQSGYRTLTSGELTLGPGFDCGVQKCSIPTACTTIINYEGGGVLLRKSSFRTRHTEELIGRIQRAEETARIEGYTHGGATLKRVQNVLMLIGLGLGRLGTDSRRTFWKQKSQHSM